jgi:hypothetical protein
MDEIISYKMCAVKVRNAKLRNYLKVAIFSASYAFCMLYTCKLQLRTQSMPVRSLGAGHHAQHYEIVPHRAQILCLKSQH